MRWLPFAALAASGCGGSGDRRDVSSPRVASAAARPPGGPDAVVVRVPRDGGRVRAYVYPRLDSVVWRSSAAAPAVARVLGFDESAGSLAVVDASDTPRRVNLRVGSVAAAGRTSFASLASSDGSGIYGVAAGAVTRLTPTETSPWTLVLTPAPRDLLPQPDGSVIVVADDDGETLVWRVRPPDPAPSDTARLPRVGKAIAAAGGDRIYFAQGRELLGLHARTLERVPSVRLDLPVRDGVATPSGDRVYLAVDSSDALRVIDRYRGAVSATVALPGRAADLRMDALGRYLLARAAAGDSAWVIAIATNRLLGSVATAWRADLPLVAPDGMIALARGNDVAFVDGETLAERQTVRGGGADFWHIVAWNGFRPRAGERQPSERSVRVARDTSARPALPPADSSAAAPVPADAPTATADATPSRDSAPSPAAAAGAAPPATRGFTVQFAAARSEAAAREVATAVAGRGAAPRIVATQTSGVTIFRVVLGPFRTDADAERAGKQSGRDYWVYEGEP